MGYNGAAEAAPLSRPEPPPNLNAVFFESLGLVIGCRWHRHLSTAASTLLDIFATNASVDLIKRKHLRGICVGMPSALSEAAVVSHNVQDFHRRDT